MRLRRQAVEVDFDGGTLTSDSGLLLLREVDRRINLISRIDKLIPDPRDLRYAIHTQAEMLTSRIFAIAAGYEDVNDHQQLRHDAAFQVTAGRTPAENNYDLRSPLASPPTISRLENRIDSRTCLKLSELFVDVFLESYATAPREIILDYDATDDLVHGEQECRHFNGFYDGYCFLPLYIFCGDQLLAAYLRPSNVGAAHHVRPITKLLVAKIRSRWPNTKIILRADSAFANNRLMSWCEKNDVGYVFGLQKNSVLIEKIASEMQQAKDHYTSQKQKTTCFKWLRYRADRWETYRWVIGKAEHGDKGPNPRFVITNLPSSEGVVDDIPLRVKQKDGRKVRRIRAGIPCSVARNPREFYETLYCMRGEMENRIKEQQLYLFADRTSCHGFMANQFRLLLSSFAYVLLDALRRLALSGTNEARWRVDTIRLRIIKIAARVRVSCRRVIFHLASHCPFEQIFKTVMHRLCLTG
jgi:hypothetical protein